MIEHTARAITSENSAAIDGVIPLIGNVTFAGEATALEQARQAYRDYQAAHQRLIQSLMAGDIAQAVTFNTGSEATQSEAAFHRLTSTMGQERGINRAVFDRIRTEQFSLLTTNQILLGIVAYLIIAVGVALGVWHRWRDL